MIGVKNNAACKRRQKDCALMRANTARLAFGRRQSLALTACRARRACFAVAQDTQRDGPGLTTTWNPVNVG